MGYFYYLEDVALKMLIHHNKKVATATSIAT